METRYTTIEVPNVGEIPIDLYIDVVWNTYYEPYKNAIGRIFGQFQIDKRQISDVSDMFMMKKYITDRELGVLKSFMEYFDIEEYDRLKHNSNS